MRTNQPFPHPRCARAEVRQIEQAHRQPRVEQYRIELVALCFLARDAVPVAQLYGAEVWVQMALINRIKTDLKPLFFC